MGHKEEVICHEELIWKIDANRRRAAVSRGVLDVETIDTTLYAEACGKIIGIELSDSPVEEYGLPFVRKIEPVKSATYFLKKSKGSQERACDVLKVSLSPDLPVAKVGNLTFWVSDLGANGVISVVDGTTRNINRWISTGMRPAKINCGENLLSVRTLLDSFSRQRINLTCPINIPDIYSQMEEAIVYSRTNTDLLKDFLSMGFNASLVGRNHT